MMRSLTNTLIGGVASVAMLVAGLSASSTALAAKNASFEGETVSVIIRSSPGGGYDFHGRLIARHLGKYLPGNPDVIAVNRPGAGGAVAANYLYAQAPKDGTEIAILSRELPLAERLGERAVRYKTLEMPPIGSSASSTRVWVAGPDVPVNNLEDLANFRKKTGRDFRFVVSGKGAGSYQMANLLKQAGYPVQVLTGFESTPEQSIAVLRGEGDGMVNTYASVEDSLKEGFKIFTKLGSSNDDEIGNIKDLRQDLSGDMRALTNVLAAPLVAGRPFFAPPGTPPERLAALQEAFRKALQDPQLQAEAKKAGEDINYTGPKDMTETYREILNAPDKVIEQFREQ
jgi:tripartite-type tricarboxylate transporter receptor subunit TctC